MRLVPCTLLVLGAWPAAAADPPADEQLEKIREEVAQWNSLARVTIHCVSVGQSSRLLAQLAGDSGGTYLEVGVAAAGEPKK